MKNGDFHRLAAADAAANRPSEAAQHGQGLSVECEPAA